MISYSVAIRTLGTKPEVLRTTLECLGGQTVAPDKVVVYIAEGYPKPDFNVIGEQYRFVPKGMAAQRLLPYKDMSSDCLLFLDDDVLMEPDSVEKLLVAMEKYSADCLGVDTFATHSLSLWRKVREFVVNWTLPHRSEQWAVKIRSTNSFSYNIRPEKDFYLTQSCAGNVMLWRREVYGKLRMTDELWLDMLPFAYGDDMVESYKVHRNGYRLGMLYNSGCIHADGKTASAKSKLDPRLIRTRAAGLFAGWWRTIYSPRGNDGRRNYYAAMLFAVKQLWQLGGMMILSVARLRANILFSHVGGLHDGWRLVHSSIFGNLPPYIIE